MSSNKTAQDQNQFSDNSLGNCLIPLLDSLGWYGSEENLSEVMPYFSEDMALSEFINTMAHLHFENTSQETNLKQIDERLFPCVFLKPNNQAIVILKKLEENKILIFNGSEIKYEKVQQSSTKGFAVFFNSVGSKNEALLTSQGKWFQKVLTRFTKPLLMCFWFTLILSIFAFISPMFVMSIYDQVLAADSVEGLGLFASGIGVFILGDFGFRLIRSKLFSYVSVRLGFLVGTEVLRRILYLPPAFTESASIGSQVARIKDFESVQSFFSSPAIIALFELPFIFLLLVGMIIVAGPVAYVPLATIILFIVFGLIMSPIVANSNIQSSDSSSKKHEFFVEILTNLRAIRYTSSMDYWLKKYRDYSAQASYDSLKSAQINSFISTTSQGLISFAALGTVVVGVGQVLAGNLSMGALMASMLLVWRILAPLKSGFSVVTQLGRILKSIAQINKLMGFRLERKAKSLVNISKQLEGRVSFTQVSIRYSPEAHPALLGVNFQIDPRELCVIVGHDGSGKSSIFNLIMSLYQPQAGRVLVDNMNIKQMDMIALRRNIGYAPQNKQLFHGSLAKNIRLLKANASMQDMELAAKKAGILDQILALPDGFDTWVNQGNINSFSSSFVYSIGLAQVFLKESNLLLLDKPETGVKLNFEQEFLGILNKAKSLSTILVISDRPSYLEIADKILWLEKGRVKRFGPAEDILFDYYETIG